MVAPVPDKSASSSSVATSSKVFKDTNQSLQERLHFLLTRIAGASDILKNWPEADDAAVHNQTTADLLTIIHKIVESIQRVEEKVNHCAGEDNGSDKNQREKLRDIQVPLDLLDLMDFGDGLNPDCFARGLLKEAERQLAGLQRRKLCLHMLGKAVQIGISKREKIRQLNETLVSTTDALLEGEANAAEETKKRKRDVEESDDLSEQPATKK